MVSRCEIGPPARKSHGNGDFDSSNFAKFGFQLYRSGKCWCLSADLIRSKCAKNPIWEGRRLEMFLRYRRYDVTKSAVGEKLEAF